MSISNKGNPLPSKLKGRFAEIDEGNHTRFFEINYIDYDRETLKRLMSIDCLDDSVLGKYISLLEENDINEFTQYLYKVQTYLGDKSFSGDIWEFNAKIFDYKEITFTSFEKLLDYCMLNFGVLLSDFLPKEETNIP